MSNTVKIKNKKKKKALVVNYKLLAVIFGGFVILIVGLSVWASFHWGVGMGTIGTQPEVPEDAAMAATDAASEFSTDDAVVLTPEQLEQMGISLEGLQESTEAEAGDAAAVEGEAAAEGAAAVEGEAAAEGAAESEAAEAGEAENGAAGEGAGDAAAEGEAKQ